MSWLSDLWKKTKKGVQNAVNTVTSYVAPSSSSKEENNTSAIIQSILRAKAPETTSASSSAADPVKANYAADKKQAGAAAALASIAGDAVQTLGSAGGAKVRRKTILGGGTYAG